MCIYHHLLEASSSSICKYASAKSNLENLLPPFRAWNNSSGLGNGYTSVFSDGLIVTLKSPHIRILPPGFLITTMGVTHSECDTFLMTPCFSNRSSSSPTTGFNAKESLRGLQNLVFAPSWRVNVALAANSGPALV